MNGSRLVHDRAETPAESMRIHGRGRQGGLHRACELKPGIEMPADGIALPTEDNEDFGTSSLYGQHSERLELYRLYMGLSDVKHNDAPKT
jgi:hypothetical protein